MKILLIALLLVGCSEEEKSPQKDPQPASTPEQTPTKTPPPTEPAPTKPPESDLLLHLQGSSNSQTLADTLWLGGTGSVKVTAPSNAKRKGEAVVYNYKLSGCSRSGVKLLWKLDSVNIIPNFISSKVGGKKVEFVIIDTSGSKQAVSGCTFQAVVTKDNGDIEKVQKKVAIREGAVALSNATINSEGNVQANIDAPSAAKLNLLFFKVVNNAYQMIGKTVGDPTPITSNVITATIATDPNTPTSLPSGSYLLQTVVLWEKGKKRSVASIEIEL